MAKPKIEIPADLTNPLPVPENSTPAELDALETELRAKAEALLADDNASAENVAQATWMIQSIAGITARREEIATADAERAAKLNEVREQLKPPAAPAEEENPELTGDDKPEGGDGGQSQSGGSPSEGAPAEPVLVASAASQRRRNYLAMMAMGNGGTPAPEVPTAARAATLVASADVAGFNAGQTLDWSQLGDAALSRFKDLPDGASGNAGRIKHSIGRVKIGSDPDLVASARVNGKDVYDVDAQIAWALSGDRLKRETGAESLTAAGGWCAPSETLYDLLDVSTTDGLINIPGITVNRGGVRYTLGPDFTAVYNAGANFTRTESQTIAGVAKPIVDVPCPTFADHRMVVDGLYLTGDILSAKGYPEAYTDYMQKSLTAFAHYVSAQTIADMVTLCGSVINLATNGSTSYANEAITTELLGAVELAITDMRYKNRLSLTNTVELVLPLWLKGAVRSDLAKKQGVDNAANISDADIETYFAQRGAMCQWVYDWQDAFTGISGGFGGSTAQVAWPVTAKFMIYPSGGFVRALSDVIELNAVYDSTLLATNQYVALFMEQARLTLKRTFDVRLYQVPVTVSGAAGAPFDYTATQPTV